MTFWTLIRRSLRFHARSHFGVVLGAAVGSAALIGALVVGDSVRESLRERGLRRLANAYFAMTPAERTFGRDPLRPDPFLQISTNSQTEAVILQPLLPPSAQVGQTAPVWSAKALLLAATASLPSGTGRANHVNVYGVDRDFWEFMGASRSSPLPTNSMILNQTLAAQLGVKMGEEVILRVHRPSAFSRDAAVAPRGDQIAALRLKFAGVLPADSGDLELQSGAAPPLNAFVPLDVLSMSAGLSNRANLCLAGPIRKINPRLPGATTASIGFVSEIKKLWYRFVLRRPFVLSQRLASTEESLNFFNHQLQRQWTLKDADLNLEYVPGWSGLELRSPRVFLDRPVVAAAEQLQGAKCIPILAYLANLMSAETNATPYSIVAAVGPPYTPAEMSDDEILVSRWLADDLQVGPGDKIALTYFDPESGARLLEHTNTFRIRSIVGMESPWADRSLMPDFPGIEKAESTSDWDAGFPLVHKIRPKDEEYWKKYRGTPKAFISLAAGQKMWTNRFGELTAIRFPDQPGITTAEHWGRFRDKLHATLKPEELGLHFEPVRERALAAANQSQDFGQLFLGFSIFLVVAALLLMALLFQFALEQRATEVGTLLALGFTARQVRRLLLLEGAALALVGGIIGVLGGLGYAKAMLWGLTTVWRSAVGTSSLSFYAAPTSLLIGMSASTFIACLTIWLALRKQARQPARELLAGDIQRPKNKGRTRAGWLAAVSGFCALATIGWALWKKETANAEVFFSAGSLLLVAGLAVAAVWLTVLGRKVSAAQLTLAGLGVRSCTRRRKRSLATMALFACGCFVILSIGVFRLDANRDAEQRTSGTGGFALLGESTLPVAQDLNTKSGREAFGLAEGVMAGINVIPFRVREGDEASCLNLNRAQKPRLLGVRPGLLEGRFTFVDAASGLDRRQGWDLLKTAQEKARDEVPAIGDANSIQWALGKKLGDTIDYTDEYGRAFKLRLVGAVANSILQGNLIIDETEFVKRFPSQSGYQMFFLNAPSNKVSEVSAALSRALQDVGLEMTSAVQRLNAFNAVQNTYLGTFQILGGLGLLLGSAGLGVVVLRNVLERRGELAVLLAMGFRRRLLQRLILTEHGALLGLGLGVGIVAAAVAVLPALLSPERHLPYVSLALTLGGVLLNGVLWTWAAIRYALRGNLLEALRNE